MSDLVTVVAVADKEPVHDYLIKGWNAFNMSLKRFGHSPVILGWNQTWKGLGSKPKLLKKAIENDQIDSEYLIFSDALDVAFIDSPEAIVEDSIRSTQKTRLYGMQRGIAFHVQNGPSSILIQGIRTNS
jgi:hypothetical protein